MSLTKYLPTDIMHVAHAIGGSLAYEHNVMRKFKALEPKDCANLNHTEVLVDPLCESVYLTLKQDFPWGGTNPFCSSIVLMFSRTTDRHFVVNKWYGKPKIINGDDIYVKQGIVMHSEYTAWKRVSQCSSDDLIKHLLGLETKVNERWRELKRMKIEKHLIEIKKAANEFAK